MAEGNSAAGEVSSPDHINVSSKKVFGGARKSATRNACAMYNYIKYVRIYIIYRYIMERTFLKCHRITLRSETPKHQSYEFNQPDGKAKKRD